MIKELETKDAILSAACNEFLQKGFHNASLRHIAAEAKVTTGAIYFFFKNKEDLFIHLLRPLFDEIHSVMKDNYIRYQKLVKQSNILSQDKDFEEAISILKIMFRHKDAMQIILENRDQPYVVEKIDELVDVVEAHSREFIKRYNIEIESSVLHWIAHLQIERFTYIFEHCKDFSNAQQELKAMVKFIRGGFFALLDSSL